MEDDFLSRVGATKTPATRAGDRAAEDDLLVKRLKGRHA
jgi:hypothetical protein